MRWIVIIVQKKRRKVKGKGYTKDLKEIWGNVRLGGIKSGDI